MFARKGLRLIPLQLALVPGLDKWVNRGRSERLLPARGSIGVPQSPKKTAMLSLLPLAMWMGGPREAVWHAIIRKNYGYNHLIVGRDHSGPGSESTGKPFYGPYEAQEMLRAHEMELGVSMVPFKLMVFVEETSSYVPIDEVPEGKRTLNLFGIELRELLASGKDVPIWFTFLPVAEELKRSHLPRRGYSRSSST